LKFGRIGVIINPIAGMGGRVGLKGTDGPDVLARARALGAQPQAYDRTRRALARLKSTAPNARLLTPSGVLGASDLTDLPLQLVPGVFERETTAADTVAAVKALTSAGIDLLLFAGGDGTARDIAAALPRGLPVLGIPGGVKMHSAVFATSPEAAGHLAGLVALDDPRASQREAEVMDLDEEAVRTGRVSATLFGYVTTPFERTMMQNCKAGAVTSDDAALDALARRIVREMEPGRLYVLGCGTTMRRIKRVLGFEGTLLGIDVVIDRRLLAADVTEERLARLVDGAKATIITSVTGGQGYVFGRGNQQISAGVIESIGRENVMIITGERKLTALDPPCLRVDTGKEATDAMLQGYWPVHTAPGRIMMMKVAA
jgi:predicted polyphosphate/ATP-dependent NAD kinase